MLFQGIAAGSGEDDHVLYRHAPVIAGIFQNLQGEFRQSGQYNVFLLHFLFQALHLLMQGSQKEQQPGLPVGGIRADGGLCLA